MSALPAAESIWIAPRSAPAGNACASTSTRSETGALGAVWPEVGDTLSQGASLGTVTLNASGPAPPVLRTSRSCSAAARALVDPANRKKPGETSSCGVPATTVSVTATTPWRPSLVLTRMRPEYFPGCSPVWSAETGILAGVEPFSN